MSDAPPSLIRPPDQPELLPELAGGAVFAEAEAVGEYTAERFHKMRPEAYKVTVALLASGVGILKVASLVRCSPNTVIAVRNREGVTIKAEKANLAQRAHVFANLGIEAATQLLQEILASPARRAEVSIKDVNDLLKAFSQAVDKGQLLSGEATARVDIPEHKRPAHEDYNAELEKLRDVTPMGSSLEKNAAPREIEAASPAPAVPGTDAVPAGPAAGPDVQTPLTADGESIVHPTETP